MKKAAILSFVLMLVFVLGAGSANAQGDPGTTNGTRGAGNVTSPSPLGTNGDGTFGIRGADNNDGLFGDNDNDNDNLRTGDNTNTTRARATGNGDGDTDWGWLGLLGLIGLAGLTGRGQNQNRNENKI